MAHCSSIPSITTVGITTNGMKLKSLLPDLVTAGLTSVNVSIDTVDAEKFGEITRRDPKSLKLLLGNIYKGTVRV